ncbi:MAG: 2-oxo acid dehydrogenase subunit E2, partial [Pseudomonadales bacterium]
MAKQVKVPDIGEAEDVQVVELLVAVGDVISKDASLVVLESDKASMEIPSPVAGKVVGISVGEGDQVEEGSLLLEVEPSEAEDTGAAGDDVDDKVDDSTETAEAAEAEPAASQPEKTAPPPTPQAQVQPQHPPQKGRTQGDVYAGPAVRKQAREYGVDLSQVTGTGAKGRILKEDVQSYVKARLEGSQAGGAGIPPIPAVDFSKFGEVAEQPLSRVRKASAKNLHRSWLNVPHVTQFDEADITDLEAFRKAQNKELAAQGVKLSPLAFMVKAVVQALHDYPQFNASLSADGASLVLKKYYNIGIAVDTEEGLVVPVVRDADTKDVVQLATETAELAAKARDKRLPLDAMQGASFTLSSLGGLGGTAFTPIVNAPEVAILGISRTRIAPVFNGNEFLPR